MSLSLLWAISPNGSPVPIDTDRLALVASSAFWFRGVLISGFVVAIGCAMELPETIAVFRRWKSARFKDEIIDENPKNWRIPVAAFGLILVILGVGAETIFESLTSNAETSIREHDSALLGNAEKDAGTAMLDAANARNETAQLRKDEQALKTEADKAKGEMVAAQVELARMTGPPYLVPVIHGVATPNISNGNKQVVLLTQDTRIALPKFPKNKTFSWTLSLIQDGVGGHHFTFSPDIGGFDPNVDVSPRTGWLVNLQTDSNGSRNTGWGGVRIAAPASIPK